MKQKLSLLALVCMCVACQEISDPSEGVSSVSSSKVSLKFLATKLSFIHSSSSRNQSKLSSNLLMSSSSMQNSWSFAGSSNRISSSATYSSVQQNNFKTFTLSVGQLASFGGLLLPSGNYSVVGVDGDIGSGGSSYITSPLGTVLGFCPSSLSECTPNWSINDAIYDGQINLNFFVYNWTRLANSTQFQAFVGFWIFPDADPNEPGSAWFDRAQAFGVTSQSVVTIKLQYTYGQRLKIKFFGDAMYPHDALHPSPEFTYQGKGTAETISIPVSQFIRPQNSTGQNYSPSAVKGIGLERVVQSSVSQTNFPVAEAGPTSLIFYSISISNIQPN